MKRKKPQGGKRFLFDRHRTVKGVPTDGNSGGASRNPFDAIAEKRMGPCRKTLRREVGNELRQLRRANEHRNHAQARFTRKEKDERGFSAQSYKGLPTKLHGQVAEPIEVVTDESDEEDNNAEDGQMNNGRSFISAGDDRGGKAKKSMRSELLSNVIGMSKRTKALRHMEREQRMDLTAQLDDAFSKLVNKGVFPSTGRPGKIDGSTSSDYDSLFATLNMEKSENLTASIRLSGANRVPVTRGRLGGVESAEGLREKEASDNRQGGAEDFVTLLNDFKSFARDSEAAGWVEKLERLASRIHHSMLNNVPYAASSLLDAVEQYSREFSEPAQLGQLHAAVLLVQLVTELMPCADPLHPVATPTLALATKLLTSYPMRNLRDCVGVVLLCAAVVRMLEESKRYSPEVTAALTSALQLCSGAHSTTWCLPAKNSPPVEMMLVEDGQRMEDIGADTISTSAFLALTASSGNQTKLKPRCVALLIRTTRRYAEIYAQQSSPFVHSLFTRFREVIASLPIHSYPSKLAAEARGLQEYIQTTLDNCPSLTQLKQLGRRKTESEKPMLEPRFEGYSDIRTPRGDGARLQKLRREAKRETRGAMRKLRIDASVVAQEQAALDSKVRRERSAKTKRILSSLQQQESEYKKQKYMAKKH